MIPITSLIKHYIQYMTYTDYIEIFALSIAIYYISIWLSQDTRHNLLGYFYAYSALLAATYSAQLYTISFCLTFFAPVICICFIIIHETTLQKNYITLRNTITPKKASRSWIEQLVRICLQSMNNNQPISCLIEQNDQLATVLKDVMRVQTDIDTGVLEVLTASPSFAADHMVWINKWGTVLGINAQWKHQADPAFIDESVKKIDTFKQDALLYTAKTDAIFFRANPHNHTFDVVAHGTLFESISTHAMVTCLKKYITPASHDHKGDTHEAFAPKKHQKQPRA